MQWFGKAIGGILGFAVKGPIGSVIGIIVGHQLDRSGLLSTGVLDHRAAAQRISQLFFEVSFEVMGQIAKIDGRVSEDEVRVARSIMHGMQLTPDQVRSAIAHFTHGKSSGYPLEQRLGALAAGIGGRSDIARAFLQIQMQAAVGAGAIDADKRQLLWRIASALGVSRAELAQIEALVRGDARGGAQPNEAEALAEAYNVLGVTPESSDDEVKRAYRRLMSLHHPDKLVARGLPESMAGMAEQKTREIRAAYEKIRDRRGFK